MSVKKVTTCINEDLYKLAIMNNVEWHQALKMGIELLVGNYERERLKEKRKNLEAELSFVNNKLNEFEDETKKVWDNVELIKRAFAAFERGGYTNKQVNTFTRIWNTKTNSNLSNSEFLKLLERCKSGEFDRKQGGE